MAHNACRQTYVLDSRLTHYNEKQLRKLEVYGEFKRNLVCVFTSIENTVIGPPAREFLEFLSYTHQSSIITGL